MCAKKHEVTNITVIVVRSSKNIATFASAARIMLVERNVFENALEGFYRYYTGREFQVPARWIQVRNRIQERELQQTVDALERKLLKPPLFMTKLIVASTSKQSM